MSYQPFQYADARRGLHPTNLMPLAVGALRTIAAAAAIISSLVLPVFGADRAPAPSEELNTLLMHTTFRIAGPKAGIPNGATFGTGFIIAMPIKGNDKIGQITLVTAAHVLDDVAGDTATILLRKLDASGAYVPFNFSLKIRDHGAPLYTKHPSADVAAMYADFPDEVPMTGLTPSMLADDEKLKQIEFHPGDEVFVLGFPLGATGPGGSPQSAAGASPPRPFRKYPRRRYVDRAADRA